MYTHVTCGRTIERGMNPREPLSCHDKNQEIFDQGNNIRFVVVTRDQCGSADIPMLHVTNYISIYIHMSDFVLSE